METQQSHVRLSEGRLFHRARVASSTPERLWSVRAARWAFASLPLPVLKVTLPAWRLWRKISHRWAVDWYFLTLDILVRSSLNLNSVECSRLALLGPSPSDLGSHSLLKYRSPLWWAAATYGKPELLDQLKSQRLVIDYEGSECNFIYMALASGNTHSLGWAVTQGVELNKVGPLGKPLLCHAISRCTPDNPLLVKLLLSGGADWYYAGPFGESAFSYTNDQPLWSVWWSKHSLQQELVKETQGAVSAKKPRRL